MSEYEPELTIGQAAELDKERVRRALAGELACGESGDGFVYEKAPKDECDAYVLGVVDNWVHQARELAASGRAMERVMEANGFDMGRHFMEYVRAHAEESGRYGGDYLYEHELEELHAEAEEAMGGGGWEWTWAAWTRSATWLPTRRRR